MTAPPVFDAHSDLPSRVVREREAGRRAVAADAFLPGMRAGGIVARVAAVYSDTVAATAGGNLQRTFERVLA